MNQLPPTYQKNEKVNLKYLFFTFLKIGCISFGGHMALISFIQRIMVDKDQTLENEIILEGITIGSLLPGPLAVNVVAYIGYHLKGKRGAIVSVTAVLLPACSLILFLAWLYFVHAFTFNWAVVMQYIGVTVASIILSAGAMLFKKELSQDYKKVILFLCCIIVSLKTTNYLATVILISAGAIIGYLSSINTKTLPSANFSLKLKLNKYTIVVLSLLLINEIVFLMDIYKNFNNIFLKIASVFSGISLSLFGGGLVVIPIMQSLFVHDLNWLNERQFVDAIAFSQLTPGPILVSSTFIGFKLAGLSGAILATVAMFIPSAILMIIVSKTFNKNKNHPALNGVITWIKPVIVSLIMSSALKILILQPKSINYIFVGLCAFILSYLLKLSPVFLILGVIIIALIQNFYYGQL